MALPGATYKPMVDIGSSPADCWEWQGVVSKTTGYGKKTVLGKSVLAHRWMYETLFGLIPAGLVVNHKCNNRKCVNPHHLELVTQAGNVRYGASTKLTAEQVAEIKEAKNSRKWGDGVRLAKKYGVSHGLIHDIWNGRAWID